MKSPKTPQKWKGNVKMTGSTSAKKGEVRKSPPSQAFRDSALDLRSPDVSPKRNGKPRWV